ncbi:MAG TPA: MFS transporter [Tepidisphaeraceae bacterium]|jgi:OPA family glycerol-3-phosphate transporter-like MFS transporter
MNHDDLPSTGQRPVYPPGFRSRRGINWGFLGLLYTSYYMCRYNLSIANKSISTEFGFDKAQMGWIITTNLLAYACGQIINGLLTDRIGGKRAMLIGAAGTIVMNILFGAASFMGMLGLFIVIWGLNGYVQAYGAPGMVKINTAWFAHRERGRFAGIFGFMINLGRFGIFKLGPALLAGFVFLGLLRVPPLHWRWLFWAPSMICAVAAVFMAIFVKETPEEAGYAHDTQGQWSALSRATHVSAVAPMDQQEVSYRAPATEDATDTRAQFSAVFFAIVSNPAVWITACAYACTGAVRQAVDQWFPRYMQDVHHLSLDSTKFQWLALLIPFVASVGSLTSGYISDLLFQSRRGPVAAGIYLIETVIILAASQFHGVNAAITFFVLISLTANSTHSLLGTAAAMDIGGRKMAGFASGVIDSFQYFGGSLAGFALGMLVEKVGWGSYFYFMAPFGIIGGLLMLFAGNLITQKAQDQPLPVAPVARDSEATH